ncbi:MFS transporter [Actinacidiphila bryophytorum]|uniref:Major Facilitator Superfamily protein n=1 Tax=Actinacidiphila bryophytorum TaxID=1436133 RepID=A0A9W4H206_9ACTN|nr:MFS transporter [Actinacidiphila bryophytorum]MBM9440656.1 MFS transporter [Actinacidiphila bryophytorum]MBN6543500.1 MFS transporter [Actinacidiphila bryophytorum]CAG7644051.1 Major Facilitator Superfamily protein [Actinacidiphila bryophytorum]
MTSAAAKAGPPAAPRRGLHPDPVVRRLSWTVLVNTFGTGLFMTVSALYFTRVAGISVGRVGTGLTAAGLCAIAASVPAGRAADRWGSRRVLVVLSLVQAAGMAAYTLVHGFAVFLVVVCAETAVNSASAAVRNALYADTLPRATRVAGRAYLRAVTNVGIGAGAALAALALQADTRTAYDTVILANAASFVAVAAMLPGIPLAGRAPDDAETAPAPAARRGGALRDGPYLLVTGLNAVLAVQFAVFSVGIPLWVVRETEAPRAVVAGAMILNTVLVVAFQVRATRGTHDPRSAARACRTSGLLLAASCAVIAASHGLPAAAAALVLLAAVVLQTAGEVLSQAGGWLLSYDLADPAATGAYQGVFNAGSSAGFMVGPAVVTATALAHGPAGWAVPAGLFAAAGAAMAPAVRWAERRRPAVQDRS